MNGNEIAVDTMVAIDCLNRKISTSNQELLRYKAVHIPLPVAAELFFGAQNSARQLENMEKTDAFFVNCNMLPITLVHARIYAELKLILRKNGTLIPMNDLWIAAICIGENMPLVTRDAHFNFVPGLQTLSWDS